MIAVDTNVLVRFLVTGDDPGQSARATATFQGERIFLARTVVLETAWVLRRSFGFDREQIAMALRLLSGLANVEIEGAAGLARALGWMEAGLDVADALHLAATPGGADFVSFDRGLARRAGRVGGAPAVREP
ncbi:MAG TPA: type II toxin-antitoxin system VapC family toxin [Geminicoccaceae bacterium]|nr:type II toxin-antitoxin system VapC family toxin [Geminicoccaceae bacterium]